jgi:hypothetical protein
MVLGLLGLAFGGWSLHRRDTGRPLHRWIAHADLYLILASLLLVITGLARLLMP